MVQDRDVVTDNGYTSLEVEQEIQNKHKPTGCILTARASSNPYRLADRNAPQDLDMVSWPRTINMPHAMGQNVWAIDGGKDTYLHLIENGMNPQHPVRRQQM